MAHTRERHIEPLLKKALTYSPCVGLTGMRQSGKSTLLQKHAKSYYTFDDDRFQVRFEREGHGILETSTNPLALDEIQKHPPAFDALKLSIDHLKKPGRFLVSGSVRFGSRAQIRESLTGRMVLMELYPFTLAECHQRPLSTFLQSLGKIPNKNLIAILSQNAWATEKQITHYFQTGGLPGICFRREAKIRSELFEAHLETLLARDIHLIKKTSLSVSKLLLLLTEIAKTQGLPSNLSHLARMVGVSMPTIRSLMDALQGLYLIRSYGNTWFFEDCGLSFHLAPTSGALSRYDLIRIIYGELRAQIGYGLKHEVSLQPYQTRGGVDIPFLIEFKNGKKWAIAVDEEGIPSNKTLKSLSWAKKKFHQLEPLILYTGKNATHTATNIPCLPWTNVF